MEERFSIALKRAIDRARSAWESGDLEQCLISSHMAAEYSLKILFLRTGKDPSFKSFKWLIDELRLSEQLSQKEHARLDSLRKLRNKVYHEAYLPKVSQVSKALKTAEKIVSRVIDENSLRDIQR